MKLLIHGEPTPIESTIVFYLSGGFIKNCGLLTYYLKDHLSNEAFISITCRQDTDFIRSTDDVWGVSRVRLAYYNGWVAMLQRLILLYPPKTNLVIKFIWVNGKFPLKAFEYIFSLTKRRHIFRVDPAHKSEVTGLSSHFSSITISLITRGKAPTTFHLAEF